MDHMNDEGFITPFAQPSDARALAEDENRQAREAWRRDYADTMLFVAEDTAPYRDYLEAGDFTIPVPKPAATAVVNQTPTTRLVPTERAFALAWIGAGFMFGFAAATIITVVTTW